MVVHGGRRYHQPVRRSFGVREPGRDQSQDLELAIGPPRRVGRRTRLRRRGGRATPRPEDGAHQGRRRLGAQAVQDRQRLEGGLDLARSAARRHARTGRSRRRPASAADRQSPRSAGRMVPGDPGRPGPDGRPQAQVHQQLRRAIPACRAGRCARGATPGKVPQPCDPLSATRARVPEAGRHQPLQHIGPGRVAGRQRQPLGAAALPCRTSTRARMGTVSRPYAGIVLSVHRSRSPASARAHWPRISASRHRRAANM